MADRHESIRAMLLTSTRAIPHGPLDRFSDYDVILAVEDIHPFYEDRRWLEDFGDVVVAYWDPLYPGQDAPHRRSLNLLLWGMITSIARFSLDIERYACHVRELFWSPLGSCSACF